MDLCQFVATRLVNSDLYHVGTKVSEAANKTPSVGLRISCSTKKIKRWSGYENLLSGFATRYIYSFMPMEYLKVFAAFYQPD